MLHFIAKVILPFILSFFLPLILLNLSQNSLAEDFAPVVNAVNSQVETESQKYKELVKQSEENAEQYQQEAKAIIASFESANDKIPAMNIISTIPTISTNQNISSNVVNEALIGYQKLKQSSCDNGQGIYQGLYIFVSFSMPKTMLNQYDKIARHLGAKLVIRGLKNNSFKETIAYIKEINAQGTVIEINPQMFKEFEINLVPAFVMTDGDKDGNKASLKFDKLIGNVSIVYVIEKFVSQGDLSTLAKSYSDKLARLGHALK